MPKTKKTAATEAESHWLSRGMERITTPVLTAAILGIGALTWNYLVTEPELTPVTRTVEQHKELISLLTQSVAQQSKSITDLATDRAGAVYGGATNAIERLEAANRSKPLIEWSVEDRRLYEAALTQQKSAAERLGIN